MLFMYLDLVKIFVPTALAFFLGLFFTPGATYFFYKYKMWKKYSRNAEVTALDFQKIHNEKDELRTPRVGGIIIWISVLLTTVLFYLVSIFSPTPANIGLNFLSRNQTLIPFFTLLLGSLVGLSDDLIQIYGTSKFARDDSQARNWKIVLIAFISLLIGSWFFYKLGMVALHIPFGGVIDGIDGLSGGVLASIFAAYSAIAFANNQIDLAAFSGAITGAILAFLWFNIPPARFYMGETGIM